MKTILVTFVLSFFFSFAGMAQNSKEVKEVVCKVNMHCMSCKNKIEKNITFEKGVKGFSADLATNTVKVKYRADKTTDETIAEAIKKLGYKVEIIEEEKE